MRGNTKHKYYGDYSTKGNEKDIDGLFDRLGTYKGRAESLVRSFEFWVKNKPSFITKGGGLRKSAFALKDKTYKTRGEEIRKRILASNNFPSNYIRVKDRSGMLAIIELFK